MPPPATPRSAPLLAFGLLVVVGLFIGLTANLVKLATAAGATPFALLFWSTLGAGLVLAAAAALAGQLPRAGRRTGEYFFMSGLLSLALPNFLIFSAVPHVGAGFAAISFAFPPLYTYALAIAFGLERFRTVRGAGILAALVGVVILAAAKTMSGDSAPIWIAATLLAPVIIAAGNIYRTMRWPQGAGSLSLAPGMLLGAALLLGLASLAATIPLSLPATPAVLGTLAAQIATFSAMYLLYFVLQKVAGPVYLSQIGSVGAISGAAVAILVLDESVPQGLLPAALLIGVGIFLLSKRSGPTDTPPPRNRPVSSATPCRTTG
ncbi:DMT family transporter [Nitratireductor alexandrii]|uniref:DMT family transporter n=1 Tax=Nitratireductor alexandrii TaxID=2448161 RepID=UPI000FDCD75E|nr:DMT family transporter [Nitratireductor alexandrii]